MKFKPIPALEMLIIQAEMQRECDEDIKWDEYCEDDFDWIEERERRFNG